MNWFRNRLVRNIGLLVGLGAGMAAYASAAPPVVLSPDQSVETTATTPRAPRRHLGHATLDAFNYVLPTDPGSTIVFANGDPNPVTALVWSRDAANQLVASFTPLAAGETSTINAPSGGVAYVVLAGAEDARNVRVLGQHNHSVNGHAVSETVPATSLEEMLPTGGVAWLPAPVDPFATSEGLVVVTGQYAVNPDVPLQLVRYNASGNDLATRNLVLPAHSVVIIPNVWDYFGLTPDASTAKGYTKIFPTINQVALFGLHTDNASGDHDTIRALSRAQMDTTFTLPIVQRLTTSVPFAQYTDLHAINPDQEPFQKWLNINFHERNVPGGALTGDSRQVYALTHDVWEDMMSYIFVGLPQGSEHVGSSGANAPDQLFVWSKIRTAMPHGDVGAWVPAMNARDACGDINAAAAHPCMLFGLNHGNGYTTKIGVTNLEPAAATITAEVYTASGVLAGTQQIPLGQYENREVDVLGQYGNLQNARVMIRANRHIQTWATTENADGDTDFQRGTRMPLPVVDPVIQYINQWFPANDARFFLSDTEARAMINGDGGTRSYVLDIATELYNDPVMQGGTTIEGIVQWLQDRADGIPDNSEFCPNFDPIQWDNDAFGDPTFRVYDGLGCGPVDFRPGEEPMRRIYDLIKYDFMFNFVNANPTLYGGQPGGAPDMGFDPTWNDG